ncbi:hypothetical protein [Micromonospora okii]|uniref:hypothetical protein n=1 Tax=Micromonospora okii TaxID=1182970 RepID=UPI001E4BFA0B|nr:hypothetical protein [Micromonospora okii]
MGQQSTSDGFRFRRTTPRAVLGATVTVTAALAVVYLVRVVVFGRAWYDVSSLLPALLAPMLLIWLAQRQAGLPLVLTDRGIVLTHPGGGEVAIDWDNVAVAQVRGRLNPVLVLELIDLDRVRPPLRRWEWIRADRSGMARARGPREIRVPVAGVTPGVGRLRAELARRRPAAPPPAEGRGVDGRGGVG